MKKLVAQLRELKQASINPDQDWVKQNRASLVSHARQTSAQAKINIQSLGWTKYYHNIKDGLAFLTPNNFVFRLARPVMAGLLIFGLVSGSWVATVAASQDSLPGDLLYSAKIAMEKTQLAAAVVVGANETETKMHVNFAKRRAQEASQIVTENDSKRVNKAPELINNLKAELKKVDEKLDSLKQDNNTSVSASALKDVSQETSLIKDILNKTQTSLDASNVSSTISNTTAIVTANNNEIAKQIIEAKDAVKDTLVKSVEVIVEKHLNGDNTVNKEEIKQIINDQIKTVAQETETRKQMLEGVGVATELAAKQANKDGLVLITDGKDSAGALTNATSTGVKVDTMGEVNIKVKAATTQAEQALATISQKVGETNVLLQKDDLQQAVKTVKEINEVSRQADQVTATTINQVKSIDPLIVSSVVATVASGINTGSASTTFTSSSTIFTSVSSSVSNSSNPVIKETSN
ncbi:MAG: hypothetical protein COU31_04580 [Candidatus Magasanikbacteria bacterium CG10_big_fil_rev_8_21_14_0_10_40_10]|uniref:DUF5667 domain-containing protein n=1 Tax=Candidatus Magasanikbacteria bacterium CG10_big_fil_rev_8_21_14_0_10_40_10 TaxID=1974648 RepID=A0A2M6W316_9BACT|nr:MAG: hypothetical protein COU31_04580 [Candidatus Magasanikbacteria bacterium CG10_big_fil_rev_8_21_14_0_10_40_10]